MTLATDIHDACQVLPQLDGNSRCVLIKRVLGRLEAYLCYALETMPAEKRFWLEALVSSVRISVEEIVLLETEELLGIFVEFEQLIGLLDELMPSVDCSRKLH